MWLYDGRHTISKLNDQRLKSKFMKTSIKQWRRKQIRIGMASLPSPLFPPLSPFPLFPFFPFPSFLLPFPAPFPLPSLTSLSRPSFPSSSLPSLSFTSSSPSLSFPSPSLRSRAPLFQLVRSGAKHQPKSILLHFNLKI